MAELLHLDIKVMIPCTICNVKRERRTRRLLVLLSLLVDKGLLVATLAGAVEGGASKAAAGGAHALELVALLVLWGRCGLVAAVDTGGCGL